MLDNLLKHARESGGRNRIRTATRYLSPIKSCVDGTCLASLEGGEERWQQVLKEADSKFVYGNYGIKDITTTQVAKGSILDFDCVLTSTRRDRDGDVLKAAGARVDPAMPLLFGHNPMAPIGKMHRVLSQDDKRVTIKCGIADVPLGRDCATLVEFGGLRISHGFSPEEFEPNKAGDGWVINKFDVLEVSLVSVPSNVDAVITAFDKQKLHHPLIKSWAKQKFDSRPTTVNIAFDTAQAGGATTWSLSTGQVVTDTKESACSCKSAVKEMDDDEDEDGEEMTCPSCGHKGTYEEFCKPSDEKKSLDEPSEKDFCAWLVKQDKTTLGRIGDFVGACKASLVKRPETVGELVEALVGKSN